MNTRALWTNRLIFFGLSLLILFVALLPLGQLLGGVPGPDLLLALTVAWVLRRPDYVPMGLIMAVGLLADALLNDPLGLWALLLLIGAEVLRRSVDQSERLTPSLEVSMAGPVILGIFILERLALMVLLAETPPLGSFVIHVTLTLLAYPAVALLTQSLLGIHRLQPGEIDSLGTRA